MDIGPVSREDYLRRIRKEHQDCALGQCQQHWLLDYLDGVMVLVGNPYAQPPQGVIHA